VPTVQRTDVKALVLLSTLLVGVCPVSAQSPVADIDRDAAFVQRSLKALKRDSVDLTGYSAEGGIAVTYRDSTGAIRLIQVHLFGESGQSLQDLTFRSGALILCQEESQTYNVPFTIDDSAAKELGTEAFDPKKTRVEHNRYYFRDGQMIRWQNSKGVLVPSRGPEFRDAAQKLLSFANELLARFK
jgi:hypothetical protein